MKTKIKISKYLQIILLLTFFLPFFEEGCVDPSNESLTEKERVDSIRITDSLKRLHSGANIDTLVKQMKKKKAEVDSIAAVQLRIKDSLASKSGFVRPSDKSEKAYSKKLSKESKILSIILRPSDNYSGIGFILDYFILFVLGAGAILAFVLWIIGWIIKYTGFNIIFHLVNISGWIFFFFANPFPNLASDPTRNFGFSNYLWGYWVCLSLAGLIIIYDTLILIQIKRTAKPSTTKAQNEN